MGQSDARSERKLLFLNERQHTAVALAKKRLSAASNKAAAVGWLGELRFSQQFGFQSQKAERQRTARGAGCGRTSGKGALRISGDLESRVLAAVFRCASQP
jgi:hypothetical protein